MYNQNQLIRKRTRQACGRFSVSGTVCCSRGRPSPDALVTVCFVPHTHTPLFTPLLPLILQVSSVWPSTQWRRGLGFLAHCFHWVSITWGLSFALSDSKSVFHYSSPEYWFWLLPSFAIRSHFCQIKKNTHYLSVRAYRLVAQSHSRLSFHQPVGSMSSCVSNMAIYMTTYQLVSCCNTLDDACC